MIVLEFLGQAILFLLELFAEAIVGVFVETWIATRQERRKHIVPANVTVYTN